MAYEHPRPLGSCRSRIRMGFHSKSCPSANASQYWVFLRRPQILNFLVNLPRVGAVLYASYLQVLGLLHQPSSQSLKRVYPPPPPSSTLAAGFAAGAVQSVVAAPLDALQARFRASDVLDGKYKSMWQYGRRKLQEIGIRATFAGWRLSVLKDAVGYAAFFATFEYVKAQSYVEFVTWYYGSLSLPNSYIQRANPDQSKPHTIKPHYAIGPTFLMLAGLSASFTQQVIQHPIAIIQQVHYTCLSRYRWSAKRSSQILSTTHGAYERTYTRCVTYARRFGGWRRWLYRGFWLTSLKQVPSTSAGLVVFELVRRRYGIDSEAVRIHKDGYDILLA